jgi:hypothetical protein
MRRQLQLVVLLLLVTGAAQAQDAPDALKRTVLEEPVKIVVGYQDGGIGATAKGDYATPFGHFVGNFTPGYTYGLDGTWTSNPDKPDQVEFSGGVGLVELNAGFPRLCGFVRILGKNGQFEKDKQIKKVNQLVAGATVEYVPAAFSHWVINMVSIPVDQVPTTNPCLGMTADERAKHPECKIKPGPPLEAPPKFTIGYYHPFRSDGDIELPEKIDADKITATFEADNRIGKKLRVVANLSGTYALKGNKEFGGKIDVGIGFPSVSERFTPVVKYVSGEKDGFKVDSAVILGVILDFAKTFGR